VPGVPSRPGGRVRRQGRAKQHRREARPRLDAHAGGGALHGDARRSARHHVRALPQHRPGLGRRLDRQVRLAHATSSRPRRREPVPQPLRPDHEQIDMQKSASRVVQTDSERCTWSAPSWTATCRYGEGAGSR
jgi:hypothetical protein